MAIHGGLRVFAKLIIVTGATLLLLGIIGLVVVAHSNDHYCGKQGYGVVFDAGSSHTSMAIYQWLGETTNGTGIASEVAYISDCTEDGIATRPDDQEAIAAGLGQCLNTAKLAVPDFSHEYTPVYLGATAGMRMLAETFPAKTDTIMKTIRKTLADSPFSFEDEQKQARILTGQSEGKDGWVSANYLAGNLGVVPASGSKSSIFSPRKPIPPRPTFGALDFGGASLQISFIPEDPSSVPTSSLVKLRLYGTDYQVYTHSYLCYGANEIRRRFEASLVKNSGYSSVLSNPCSPSGYSYTVSGADIWKAPCSSGPADMMDDAIFTLNGTSDPEGCYNATKRLFDFGAPCAEPPCSIDGVHSPLPFGSFKAFNGFAYTSNGVGLSSTPTLPAFLNKTREYCTLTIDELNRLPEQFKFKLRFCFQGMYIRIILLEAFKFEESNWDMEFTLKVNNVQLGWSLGYMVDATNRLPEERPCVGLIQANMIGLLFMLVMISLLGLLLVVLGVKISGMASPPSYQAEVV
ncbi:ectonucleoside triphosphate diphosphohydrolase 8-like isoform X1 [Asterias amurensis]|uniref:ectonucleoside triphosphate diphosphohydrolase 8-like isoform X1 n=2 Tax=Asterias amurensis TaxID=7602 RepID=UPI003AB789EB